MGVRENKNPSDMWAFLYETGFWLAVASLVAWVFVANTYRWYRYLVWAFIVGVMAWGAAWLFGVWGLGFKLWVGARDLLVAGALLLAATFVKRAPSSWHWLAWLIVPVGFLFYHDNLRATFAERQNESGGTEQTIGQDIPLDPAGELLVEVREPADPARLQAALAPFDIEPVRAFAPAAPETTHLDAWFVVDVPSTLAVARIKEVLTQIEGVEWVEENEQVQASPMPAALPRRRSEELGVNDPEADRQWGLSVTGMAAAYQLLSSVQPSKTALVAILDSGVDARHEDLKEQFVSQGPRNDRDVLGHGTHVAGIAGAVTNNGLGIAGPAPNDAFLRLTSIKVLTDNGTGSQRTIIDGIIKAADAGADVINLSLGGPSTTTRQRAYEQAVQYAAERGAIVVAAAGNANSDARRFAPANVPGLISVAAVDTNLNKASFSNFVTHLDMGIAAPGTAIHATLPNNRYAPLSGTSMAAPFISGVLALMKALKPDLDTETAWQILDRTGKKTGDTRATGKLVQVDKALEEVTNGR